MASDLIRRAGGGRRRPGRDSEGMSLVELVVALGLLGVVVLSLLSLVVIAIRLNDIADQHGKTFRYGLRKSSPAWWRYAYAFHMDDIYESIRWALGRFNEIAP